ncbi:hypothetical protein D3C80_1314380 [compost metagenome]
MDALSEKYPNISTYAYVANMPTIAVDPDGNRIILFTESGATLQYRNGNAYHYGTNKIYNATGKGTIDKVIRSYQRIEASNNKILKSRLNQLVKSDKTHNVVARNEGVSGVVPNEAFMKNSSERTGTDTFYNLSDERKASYEESNGVPFSDFGIIVHEMQHQYDYDIGNVADDTHENNENNPVEVRGVYLENIARALDHLPGRKKYGGEINKNFLINPPNFIKEPYQWPEIEIPPFIIGRKATSGGNYDKEKN